MILDVNVVDDEALRLFQHAHINAIAYAYVRAVDSGNVKWYVTIMSMAFDRGASGSCFCSPILNANVVETIFIHVTIENRLSGLSNQDLYIMTRFWIVKI